MTLNKFIQLNNIRPADVIIAQHRRLALVDHYVIYLGCDWQYGHIFIANFIRGGVRILTPGDLALLLRKYEPVGIRRYAGNDWQRQQAVQRALSRADEDAYNLILNNCEHFANWVQTGEHKSQQVDDAVKGFALGGLIAAFAGLIILAGRSK